MVLLDIQLPDLNGIEVMKAIREKTERKIPIIAVTAHAMLGDKESYLREGFDDYVSKPLNVEDFQQTVMGFLQKKDS